MCKWIIFSRDSEQWSTVEARTDDGAAEETARDEPDCDSSDEWDCDFIVWPAPDGWDGTYPGEPDDLPGGKRITVTVTREVTYDYRIKRPRK